MNDDDDMDITDSLAPKSDQLDNTELATGPRTFTIERVTRGNAEQPWNFHLIDFPRVWRPGKSMLHVIKIAWGPKAKQYAGQSVTLFRDPSVKYGGNVTGGTRISHMTGIDKTLTVTLMVSRGQFAPFTVQPLTIAPSRDWLAELDMAGTDLDAIGALGRAAEGIASPAILSTIRAAYVAAKSAPTFIETAI